MPEEHKASVSRRAALAALMTSGTVLGACSTVREQSAGRRALGLADLTVASALSQDYAGTLRAVAAMGYSHFGFRLAGYSKRDSSELPPAEKTRLVRAAGLQIGVVRYGHGRSFAEQARDAQSIGATIIAYSAAPVFSRGRTLGQTTRAAFDAWLPELGDMARIAGDHGLRLAYHNHWWDHAPLEGETPLDLIAATYSPSQVAFEIDLAWAWIGGVDPVGLVTKLGTRVSSMHFKDVDPSLGSDRMKQLVEPGAGRLDYAALLPRLDRVTTAIGYVEVDAPADGMTAAANSIEYIRGVRNRRL